MLAIAVIFDPKTRKFLIARREKDPYYPDLTWTFPGGRIKNNNEDIDKTLKKTVKEYTGYDVKNLGTIFTKKYEKNNKLILIYFLCEVFKGNEKPDGKKIKELKWVRPQDLEKHFTTPFHTRLKEYIMNLK